MTKLRSTPEIKRELQKWGLRFDPDLLTVRVSSFIIPARNCDLYGSMAPKRYKHTNTVLKSISPPLPPSPWQGRVLPAEKIIMQTELPAHKPQDAEWSREMKGKRQLTSFPLTEWAVVFCKRDVLPTKNLVGALQKVCPQMGMMVSDRERWRKRDESGRQIGLHRRN